MGAVYRSTGKLSLAAVVAKMRPRGVNEGSRVVSRYCL